MPDPTETGCGIWLGDAATNMVSAAYDHYTEFASAAYSLATGAVNGLQNFTIAPVQFGVSYNLDGAVLGYHRPNKPAAPTDLAYRDPGEIPDAPGVSVPAVSFDALPAAPVNVAPVMREYPEPGELTAVAPDGHVTLQAVPVPVRPDYVLPPVPTLTDLHLPDAPTLNLPAFDGVRPDTHLDAPAEDFSFTAEQYTSQLLTKTATQISFMMDGGTGLPSAIAQALRDRGYAALDVQELRVIQQATEEYGARGFAEPSGILHRRLAEVRQNNQNQRSAHSRDVVIQDEQIAVENLRFAVTQGIALESALFQNHNEFARISLEAAQVTQTLRIRVFEARVSLVQLALTAYTTDATVWREKLQGELARLDVYRAELQALQVMGELNTQQVQLYSEQLKAVGQVAELYRTDIEAARLVVATNQQQLEIERTAIQNYAERVNAYKTTWDAYATKLSSNTLRANVYQITEQGYATRLRGWSDVQGQKLSRAQMEISVADLQQRAWRGKLDRLLAEIQAEQARIGTASEVYRSQVAAYGAEAAVETAASDANLRALQLAAERERSRTEVALKNAEIAINQLLEVNRLLITKEQTVAQTSSQLAAASMSAVNFSAGVSSKRDQSQSCGTHFNYSANLNDTPAS